MNEVQQIASVGSQQQIQSVAAVAARCTIALADGMADLSGMAFTAKQQIVDRLDKLSARLEAHENALKAASNDASAQTRNLLGWNKALVIVTGVYTLISFGLLLATVFKAR